MPDDYATKQKTHAEKIAVERQLTEITGLSRQQLRKSLVDFNRQVEGRRTNLQQAPANPPAPPAILTDEAKFEPKALTLAGTTGGIATTPAPTPSVVGTGTIEARMVIIVSGVLTTSDVTLITG